MKPIEFWREKKIAAERDASQLQRRILKSNMRWDRYRKLFWRSKNPRYSQLAFEQETKHHGMVRKFHQLQRRIKYFDERILACQTLDRFARALRNPPI